MMDKFHKIGWISGLAGRRSGPAWHAKSISACIRTLRAKGVCTSASDWGCITVWRMRSGTYRMEFLRYMVTIHSGAGATIADVKKWLDKHWWRMSEAPSCSRRKAVK